MCAHRRVVPNERPEVAPRRPVVRRFFDRLSGRPEPPDPFIALSVQIRLGVVANDLRTIDADDRMWARGHRRMAAQIAYDALLRDACRLAGVGIDVDPTAGADGERMREELELASRGWSW